jgi:hypothetical protein
MEQEAVAEEMRFSHMRRSQQEAIRSMIVNHSALNSLQEPTSWVFLEEQEEMVQVFQEVWLFHLDRHCTYGLAVQALAEGLI